MLKYFGIIISIAILLINLFYFDFEESLFSEDNKVALIGIIGSLCAMVLILILIISEKINSKIKGTILKSKKRNKNSAPVIPLSIIRLIAPVFLVRWKLNDKECIWLKAFKAINLKAFCPTKAKITSLNWVNPTLNILKKLYVIIRLIVPK